MFFHSPTSLIAYHWKFIFGVAVVTSVIVLLFSLLWPLEYRSTVRILVTPIVTPSGVVYDQYTALKSAEHIAETLSSIIHTILFQGKVLSSQYAVGLDNFDTDLRIRRKQWAKKIDPLVIKGTGIISISVYDEEKTRAENLSRAVSETLVKEASGFVPGRISLRVVDPPITSRFPVRPNLPLRFVFGFIFGSLFAGVYVYMTPHTKRHDEFKLI